MSPYRFYKQLDEWGAGEDLFYTNVFILAGSSYPGSLNYGFFSNPSGVRPVISLEKSKFIGNYSRIN